MIKKAILITSGLFNDNDSNDCDYELWKSIAEFMNGETAWVTESSGEEGVYVFLGLKDEDRGKELTYMMEQDSVMGTYIDNREDFDSVWESEEYDPPGCFYLEEKYIEFGRLNEGE